MDKQMKFYTENMRLQKLHLQEEIKEMKGYLEDFSLYRIKHLEDGKMPLNDKTINLLNKKIQSLEDEYARLVESEANFKLDEGNNRRLNIAW